jgi:hypothetical protein
VIKLVVEQNLFLEIIYLQSGSKRPTNLKMSELRGQNVADTHTLYYVFDFMHSTANFIGWWSRLRF